MPPRFRAIKGTRDILPAAQARWNRVWEKARVMSEARGYRRIDTPIFEQADLFRHAVGDATDVVNKQMYNFVPYEGREELVLRPEATASVCRAYIENGMNQEPKPVRLYYVGPMFRYENPQKGRWRQFHQFGAEQFGDDSANADFGLILLAWSFLRALGLKDLVIKINTLGDREDREGYLWKLREYYESKITQLGDEARQRLARSPLRLLDAAENDPHLMELAENAPKITDAVNPAAKKHFKRLEKIMEMHRYDSYYRDLNRHDSYPYNSYYISDHSDFEEDHNLVRIHHNRVLKEIMKLDRRNSEYFDFELDHKIVRGLDYYNRTVFEITQKGAKGRQSALIGGGRYDHLVEQLGGLPTPATGFAAGLDRIVELLQEEDDEKRTKRVRRTGRICLIYTEGEPSRIPENSILRWGPLDMPIENIAEFVAEKLRGADKRFKNVVVMLAPKQFGKYRRRVAEKSNAQFAIKFRRGERTSSLDLVLERGDTKENPLLELLNIEISNLELAAKQMVRAMWGKPAKRPQ